MRRIFRLRMNLKKKEMPSSDTYFTSDNARDMQKRSAKAHIENTARRKALREILFEELAKPVSKDSKLTKLEWLVMRAIENTREEVELSDLLKIQELLGEKQMTYNLNAGKDSEQILKDVFGDEG